MYLRSLSSEQLSRFRFTLGMAQMFGAVVSLTLLLETGLNALSLASTIGTGVLTGASIFVFKGQRPTPGEMK